MNKERGIIRPVVFLTPLELVLIEKILLRIGTKITRMKMRIVFLLCCLAGLRLREISELQLSDFVREPKTGLLARDEKNRAVLRLPTNKGKYHVGSHPQFVLVLVPHLADAIDCYLKSDAMAGAPANAYLIHKGNRWSCGRINPRSITVFFQRYKSILSAGLVHHPKGTIFSLYDLRHTCHDLIIIYAQGRYNISQIIARIHLRQQLGYSYSSLKFGCPITRTEYYDAVLYTLGFPWDEREIKMWIKEREQQQSL
ncbi:MAG: hypothetical protein WC947_09445 [Elusimicrobiota bacterium]